jgi:hypothetical protein
MDVVTIQRNGMPMNSDARINIKWEPALPRYQLAERFLWTSTIPYLL